MSGDQTAREREMTGAAVLHMTKVMMIEQASDDMEPLIKRISALLLHYTWWRHTAANVRVLQSLYFVRMELRHIAASLSQLLPVPDLGSGHVDSFIWLSILCELVRYILNHLDKLNERASCFSRNAEFQLPHLDVMLSIEEKLCWINRQPCRYELLVLAYDNDGDRNRVPPRAAPQVHSLHPDLLVGIECIRKKLLRWFTANGNQEDKMALRVASFVGPAGVGKTVLAMEIYRHLQRIGGDGHFYFECCASANVSRRPSMKVLLKHIMCQIHGPAASTSVPISEITQSESEDGEDEQQLLCYMNQCLQDRRYLIVIDDLWKETDWDIINSAFPRNGRGSRVIVTTRLRSVARYTCGSNGIMHEVKPLNQVNSERLLSRSVLGSENGTWPDSLMQCRGEILRRCQGIPFFLSGMAGWLRQEQEELQRFSTYYSLEEVPEFPRLLKQFEQTLYPTFDDLPCGLKVLLLYMSMFPEGYMFDKDRLIRKWMAEGLTGSYEEAEACFSKLIDRNAISRAIEICEHTPQPQVEEDCRWQVNYFMLQFLAYKLDETGFACTSGVRAASPKAIGSKELCWLSLHQPDPELEMLLNRRISHMSHFHRTRSLAIYGEVKVDKPIVFFKLIYLVLLDFEGWQCLEDEDILLICSIKMLFLRYLNVKNTRVRRLPAEIKELCNLQTLDISHTEVSELPSETYELPRLETLDLRRTAVKQLPEQIRKMQSMRHLLIGGDGARRDHGTTVLPEGIGCLLNLRTLATVDLSVCSTRLVEALGGIESLTVLVITCSFHRCTDGKFQEALRCSFRKWGRLKSLTIYSGLGCRMEFLDSLPDDQHRSNELEKFKVTGGGKFLRIPRWFHGLDHLAVVEITVLRLVPEDLSILGNLTSLEYLMLGLDFLLEEAIAIGRAGFRKLERLSIGCRVPWLTFSQGAMQRLRYLEMKIGGGPVSRPDNVLAGINNLSSLLEVSVHYNARYLNSPVVVTMVAAVRKGVAEHLNPINLFVNGIQDQEEEEGIEVAPAEAAAVPGNK